MFYLLLDTFTVRSNNFYVTRSSYSAFVYSFGNAIVLMILPILYDVKIFYFDIHTNSHLINDIKITWELLTAIQNWLKKRSPSTICVCEHILASNWVKYKARWNLIHEQSDPEWRGGPTILRSASPRALIQSWVRPKRGAFVKLHYQNAFYSEPIWTDKRA